MKHRKDTKWVFWVYEQLCRIEDSERIEIDSKPEFFNICLENWSKKPSDWMCDFSEEQIRKHVPKEHQSGIVSSLKKYIGK